MSPDYDPQRQFRIPDSEWLPFEQAAKTANPDAGRSPRGKVLREFIAWYMRRPGAKLPQRPDAGPWSTPASEHAPPAEHSDRIDAPATANPGRAQVD